MVISHGKLRMSWPDGTHLRPGSAQLCQGTMMRSKVKAAGKSASRPLGWPWMVSKEQNPILFSSWGYFRDGKPPIPTAKWEIHNHGMEWDGMGYQKKRQSYVNCGWTSTLILFGERCPCQRPCITCWGHTAGSTKVLLIAGWQYVAYKHKHACRRKSHTKVAYTRVSKSMYVCIYIHIHHSYTLCMYIHIYICYYIYTYYYTYIYIYIHIYNHLYISFHAGTRLILEPRVRMVWGHISSWYDVWFHPPMVCINNFCAYTASPTI